MVPPTGTSDSILVIRRNGASLEPFSGALALQTKDQSMDLNDQQLSKSLGEKWKISKPGKSLIDCQMIEGSNFMVHPDYLTKYGTLSNGVLTKSIKYAETWLYGTMGGRGAQTHRPSLFLYPGVVAPAPRIVNQGNYLTPPGSYLGFPKCPSSERNSFIISQPRKHTIKQNDLRSHQCSDCGKDIRSGICSLCKKCIEKRKGTCKRSPSSLKDAQDKRESSSTIPDPYNLMRKSRLGAGELSETSMFNLEYSQRKKRNASASPLRRKTSPSFETFRPKESKPWKSNENDWTNRDEEVVRRKSILECGVNAYELNKTKTRDVDDSSDDSSQGLTKVSTKLKILRPKLNKTDLKSSKSEAAKAPEEVRLSGQRFKIIDRSNPSTSVFEEYISDDEECKKAKDPIIPRLSSPKRPPRRLKNKMLGGTSFKYSRSKSKSSPNLSIKSILKKPGGGDDGSLLELSVVQCEKMSADVVSEQASQQPRLIKKQNQSTLKKKKQVQFRMNVSNESLNKQGGVETAGANKEKSVEETVHRSKSCENLTSVSAIMDGYEAGNEGKNEKSECDEQTEVVTPELQHDWKTEEESFSQESKLKRSYSDRRSSPPLVLYKDDLFPISTSPHISHLFNDTMALRTKATRLDSREIFSNETEISSSQKLEIKLDKKKESPTFEPKLFGNIISFEEFSKRIDSSPSVKETKAIKSKFPLSSNVMAKKKSLAPNPPLQDTANNSQSVKSVINKNVGILVHISTEKPSNSVPSEPRYSKPTLESNIFDFESAVETETEGKTLVTLSPSQEVILFESPTTRKKRPSITIHPKNLVEEPENFSQRKTSVTIKTFDPQDSNKVTISVRNDEEPNASTCTIIETGSNSTVIPVLSTDNKTTLIVNTTSSASPSADATPSSSIQESPKPYIFSDVNSEVEFMDPVEAVRRNLVPHICGKEDNNLTLMEKIRQSRETKEPKNIKQISQLFGQTEESSSTGQPSQFLLSSYQNKKTNWKIKLEEDSSTTTSRSNSFCSTLNSSIKNSSCDTSRSNSFRSSCYKSLDSDYDGGLNKFYTLSDAEDTSGQERDKLECEYEIRNGFKNEQKDDDENIYETIKEEPIYDQISVKSTNNESEDDVPPPLPLTLPPSLDELDKRSTKSIFEGASKYEILNYLVDAKERVQEECYYSGSSASDDADGRREKNDRSLDMSATSDTRRKKSDENISAENDSGFDMGSRLSNLSQTSYSSDDNMTLVTPERESLKLTRKSSAEIERNDSGVGSETSHTSRSKWQAASTTKTPQHLCEDCDQFVETQVTDSGVMYAPLVCRKCSKRRSERKEIIQEIVETEEKYGRDLRIILEEFYTPMLVAGLLTPDQLSAIFLNTEELLENSEQLTEKLRDALEIAIEQGDEDLLTVNVGKLFVEAGPMLHAFESYCTRQGAAAVLLANLEKEKELLRIFLRVSQMENTVLRRMNLNSFLMVPVQRVTKYPLLLARLYKVTPSQQEGREFLKEAQHNIELHLEHMNSEAKDISATKVWRRFSTSVSTGRKSTPEFEMINIRLRKMAVDVLDWNHEEVRFVMEGKLLYTQPTDNNWKKGRTIKLTPIFVLLVTLGKPNAKYKVEPPDDELTFPTKTGVREATLLLVKEKCGRYSLIREPLYLDKIIVCCETDVDEFFEIQELLTKDSFIFKAEDGDRTKEWYKYLQYHAQILGSWRRRRNALANIMINGMMARAYTS